MESKKVLSIVNLVLYICTVTINALANILPINGMNTGELSDKYPNLFVPAGITFSIWGLIYLHLLLLTIYNIYIAFKDDKRDLNYFNILLTINFILNSAWILFWHYEFLFMSWLTILGILVTLWLMDRFLDKKIIHGFRDKVIFRYAISIYYAWITVATIANTTVMLVKAEWNGFNISNDIWAIILIVLATIIAVIYLIKYKNIPFALVFIWAFIGIILKRLSASPIYYNIINVTTASIVIIIILSICTYIRIKPKKIVI